MTNVVIDLSHWQNPVNFNQVAADGIKGVVHKATQGTTGVDPNYRSSKQPALSANLLWGAYHFGTNSDGVAQAKNFLNVVAPSATDLLVLDFESNSASGGGGSMTADQAVAFVQYVHAQTGRYPGLYSTNNYLTQTGAATRAELVNCWLWIANYNNVPAPAFPPLWPTWTMWQYTQSGSVRGINGNCDRDTFNGPLQNLYRLWNSPAPAGL